MKPFHKLPMLTVTDSILLLAHLRRLNIRPFLAPGVFKRCCNRIKRKYGVDITGKPSPIAYELLIRCGGDLQLWPDENKMKGLPNEQNQRHIAVTQGHVPSQPGAAQLP